MVFVCCFFGTSSIKQGPVNTAQEEFENAALILRLGLPSTLIRHENRVFRKRSSNRRNLKTLAFRFRMDGKLVRNRSSNPKWPVIFVFQIPPA